MVFAACSQRALSVRLAACGDAGFGDSRVGADNAIRMGGTGRPGRPVVNKGMIEALRSGMAVNERATQAKGPDGTNGFHLRRRKAAATAVAARVAAVADGELATSVFHGPTGWHVGRRAAQATRTEVLAATSASSASPQPSWRDRWQQQQQQQPPQQRQEQRHTVDGEALFRGRRATRQQQPHRTVAGAVGAAGQPAQKLTGLALLLAKQG